MQSDARIRVLGVSSSMRARSYSKQALEIVLEHARKAGAEAHLLDLRQAAVPIYVPDVSEYNSKDLDAVTLEVERADAFVLATPDYHGSMSGAMKNFLDHYWHEFAGKLFGYVVASHEKGLTVMDHMRTAVRQCYGWSMPYGVSLNSEQDFANGSPNEKLAKRLGMLGRDLTVYGKVLRSQFAADFASTEQDTFVARFR
ncbi:MAG: NAD(P)H-dependent oxidoreductase [Nitrososphaera sp.]